MSDDRFGAVRRLAPSLPAVVAGRGDPAANVTSLAPFLTLARELAALIVPVQPCAKFRADLGRDLVLAARQQVARDRLMADVAGPAAPRAARRWAIGAATVGSAVSLAGIVALVVYRRRRLAA